MEIRPDEECDQRDDHDQRPRPEVRDREDARDEEEDRRVYLLGHAKRVQNDARKVNPGRAARIVAASDGVTSSGSSAIAPDPRRPRRSSGSRVTRRASRLPTSVGTSPPTSRARESGQCSTELEEKLGRTLDQIEAIFKNDGQTPASLGIDLSRNPFDDWGDSILGGARRCLAFN